MNYIVLLLLLLPLTLLYSNTTIADDDFTIQLDKTAHYTTSFGLYFFFHTMYTDSLLPMDTSFSIPIHSMISSTIVGLSYEVYQSTPISKSAASLSSKNFDIAILPIPLTLSLTSLSIYIAPTLQPPFSSLAALRHIAAGAFSRPPSQVP